MDEWSMLLFGTLINAILAWGIAWVVSSRSCKKINQDAMRRDIDDSMSELEWLVSGIWTGSISDLDERDILAKESSIIAVLEKLKSRCRQYFHDDESAAKQAHRILKKIRENSTLDIEKLAQEKRSNQLFETALSRSRRIGGVQESIEELKQLFEK